MENNTNKHQSVSSIRAENQPVIAGIAITTDTEGRFNLNCLHRSSGTGKEKAPNEWLRLKQTKELVAELDSNLLKSIQTGNLRSAQKSVNVINGGNSPGTFAHELLVVEYAGWVSPAFRLQVNQAFIDFRTGKLAPANSGLPDFEDPIAAAEAWVEAQKAERLAVGYADRQARYINKLENHLAGGITPVQFCKQLNGVNTRSVNAFLEECNWLFDDQPKAKHPRWRVKHYAHDQYLTECPGQVEQENGEMRDTFKPILKQKGAAWLYRHYLNGELPMKKTWDGQFTHDTDLMNLLQGSK